MIPIVAPLLIACAPLGAPGVRVPDAVTIGMAYDPENAFAKVVRGGPSQPKVYEDKRIVAFMDYAPASPGHVLVISKTSRARNLLEMSDGDLKRVLHVARRIGRAEISGLGADGFTIEQNTAFSQSVPHLHVHVIPRYLGYNRCVGSGLRQPSEALAPFAARLRAALLADRGQRVPAKPADDLPPPAAAPVTPFLAMASDPPANAARAAAIVPFQLPSHGALLNAVFYTAAGAGPHPTMLLLHGLPGNEQNLDLAQAVRRAGWNVLTLHYRGSWGSPGRFSFEHCAEDAAAALAWLRDPAHGAAYGIDTGRLVVAGHSMGGAMAARLGAEDAAIAGIVLIDPADFAATGRSFVDPAARAAFAAGEIRGDLPPLAGTSEQALMDETEHAGPAFDLALAARRLGTRPLLVIGAQRGIGRLGAAAADAARDAGNPHVSLTMMPTDHSFSDSRIALQTAVLGWLYALPH